MFDTDLDSLRRIAAQMYNLIKDSEDIGDCLEPTGEDEACPSNCSECEWYTSKLRDELLRLGVDI